MRRLRGRVALGPAAFVLATALGGGVAGAAVVRPAPTIESVYGSPANGWSVGWSDQTYDSYPAFRVERWLCHNGPMSDEATPRMKGRCVGRALERQYWLKHLRNTLGSDR